ncbi:universal stress protein [Salinibaculum rarum]|uniref:universal stress protein n=1 Tax=Salinibaculum rarum TaxID=3058903 RepID=UPI00265DCAB0|nr:universal stress protein [Salinibaculum sp. KK48]
MYDQILVPTDGSEGSAHVALQAIDLAEQYGAAIHVLYVVDDSVRSILHDIGSQSDSLEQKAETAIERVTKMASVHGVEAVGEVREGDPADEILAYADEIAADAIVAGTHGRSGVERRLIGSVAERLVRHANCPVMTIRLPETDVTVDDADHATALTERALDEASYTAEVTGAERQRSVWVVDAETDDESLTVYLDPVTQRTSIVSHD